MFGVALVVGMTFSCPVRANDVAEIGASARHIKEQTQLLRKQYLSASSFQGKHYAEERLIDGENYYRLKDYDRASIILMDVIENFPNHAAFPEALFYYADSLFLSRDYYGARTEFRRFIAYGERQGFKSYRLRVISRLVEVAIHLNDFQGVDAYIALFGSNLDAQAHYVKGKFFYFQKQYESAILEFGAVAGNTEMEMKAAYFAGATKVKQEDYDEAIKIFSNAVSKYAKVEGALPELVDLLYLGQGRLLYEKDFVENAAKAYGKINKYSPYYAVALYEAAAVQMRAGNTIGAERLLEVLTLAIPDSKYIPKAKLLRGHLLLSAGRYKDAEKVFEQTVDEFSPVQQMINRALKQSGDTGEFFDLLMAQSVDALNVSSAIPPEVVMWAGEEPEVKRAFVVTDDLSKARTYTKESDRLLGLIGAVVNSTSAVNAIPMLKDATRRAQRFRNELAHLESRLMIEVEEEFSSASSQQLSRQRQRMMNILTALPRDDKMYQKRENVAKQVYTHMRLELSRQEVLLDKLLAVIVGLERYISKPSYQAEVTKAMLDSYWSQLKRYRAGVETTRESIAQIKQDIEKAKYQIGVGGEQDRKDALFLDRWATLSKKYVSVIPSAGTDAKEISAAFRYISAARREIVLFRVDVDKLAGRKVSRIKRILDSERVKVKRYKAELADLNIEAREVVNGVARENFSGIRKRFHDLLLKADVGIVDIAWMRKEEHKNRSIQLSKRRTNELQKLDSHFNEMETLADIGDDE